MRRLARIATTLLALLPAAAAAEEYARVLPERSAIGFGYRQMNVPMEGSFKRFTAELRFDPARPAAARATIEIPVASIDTGLPEVDQEAQGKAWFDAAAHPVARFASTAVKPLGGNRYEVAGKLTIKGRTRELSAPVTFTPQGAGGLFEGRFAFKRADFAIGEGAWSAFDTVANEITVKFRIAATRGP